MNPRHLSQSAERYTPPHIIEPCRSLFGGFDLDPASCEKANRIVKASSYFTAEDSGLDKHWHGRVFLNPPGTCKQVSVDGGVRFPGCGTFLKGSKTGKPKARKTCSCNYVQRFWSKLVRHVIVGDVSSALWVGFNCSQLQTLQSCGVSPLDFPTCFFDARIKYLNSNLQPMPSPPHNSYATLVVPGGSRLELLFAQAYRRLGVVTARIK